MAINCNISLNCINVPCSFVIGRVCRKSTACTDTGLLERSDTAYAKSSRKSASENVCANEVGFLFNCVSIRSMPSEMDLRTKREMLRCCETRLPEASPSESLCFSY